MKITPFCLKLIYFLIRKMGRPLNLVFVLLIRLTLLNKNNVCFISKN